MASRISARVRSAAIARRRCHGFAIIAAGAISEAAALAPNGPGSMATRRASSGSRPPLASRGATPIAIMGVARRPEVGEMATRAPPRLAGHGPLAAMVATATFVGVARIGPPNPRDGPTREGVSTQRLPET